ncbi:MAG: FtsQ-type POTRA domain-containing protein [Solobacterium sp.]|nr:FtsQ-type POTRA domain-containing protein [Solobacterium sp.]
MVDQAPKTNEAAPKSVDTLFEERAAESDNETFAQIRRGIFLRAVFLSVLLLVLLYLFSPDSRVKAVAVQGNNYLTGPYIESLSGVSVNDLLFMQFPDVIARKIKKDPMIADASVHILRNNLAEIVVTEKQPIGYRYDEEEPTILFTDGSICSLKSEYMRILSRIPYITGFNEETQTHLLTTGFQSVNPEVIESIAEVIQYPLSYDDEAVEIRMRDGGVFFGNYFSLALINNYETISALMTNKDLCVYADNATTVAAARACPWDEVETVLEYWTDEDGNYIYNKWGDRAVKHYYSDNNGNFYLDENGNKILIPIDAYGQDQKDPDFLTHFFEGWYKNGYLEEPKEEDTEDGETDGEGTEPAEDGTDGAAEENGADTSPTEDTAVG